MNGINLNTLGIREPEKYGTKTLDAIIDELKVWSESQSGLELEFFTTNFEGEFVEKLHSARNIYNGIVMNCGAWSHYSVGIRDAVSCCALPCVEVHMTNVYAREQFRHNQVIAPVCVGQISGFGDKVYRMGVEALMERIEKK